jgi:MGT family glycosyltransferase
MRSRALWAKHFFFVYARRIGFFLVRRLLFWPEPPRELRRKIQQLKKSAGLNSMFSEYSWRFDLPEFVLCPRALDFPIARSTTRRYFGVTIDRRRVDVPFDHQVPDGKELVYVTLGTHAAMYGKKIDRFFRCLIEAAKTMPACYFIVNIGKGNDPAKFGKADNVFLTDFVPQLQILDRAAAIVTNGGLGTVKEAIMAQVPLLVVPCRWDQFGNAARVKLHGIGDYCNIDKVTAPLLRQRIDHVLNDGGYRSRLASMKQQIEEDDEFSKGMQWLCALAPRDAAHSR